MSINLKVIFNRFNADKVNSANLYAKNREITPRNIYLAEGRLLKKKDVDKYLKRIEREAIFAEFIDKVKNFFKVNKRIVK